MGSFLKDLFIMYLVAAYDNNRMIVDTMRLVRKEAMVIKHLRYIAKHNWVLPYDLQKLLDIGWYRVYNLETNDVNRPPKLVSKSTIKKWIEDESFSKVVVDVKR